jgi:hypothetical protein
MVNLLGGGGETYEYKQKNLLNGRKELDLNEGAGISYLVTRKQDK